MIGEWVTGAVGLAHERQNGVLLVLLHSPIRLSNCVLCESSTHTSHVQPAFEYQR
jgi:hypothetical protein